MTLSSESSIAGGSIALSDVEIEFGEGKHAVRALNGIDLAIERGEFVSILGPSGCGKSTVIGAIAGFTPLTRGQVRVDARPVSAPGPDRGVVFQQHALFPWKTIARNVEFGLKMRGIGKRERERTARAILERIGLAEFAQHYPHQLSGGMQQRVALARVLVNRPRALLMDEPFCSLDAQTRLQMQQMLLELWHELRMTVVFVTHDVDEAVFLSDRVVVLTHRPGSVKAEIPVSLPRPRTADVLTSAEFTGLKRHALELLLSDSAPYRSTQRRASPTRLPA
jgi:NitT/TauT family transport system ATP-binding protein